jgi:thiol-disulfide isomerase/thioredoxin
MIVSFLRKYGKYIALSVVLSILLSLIYVVYNRFIRPKTGSDEGDYVPNQEFEDPNYDSEKEAEVILFWAGWCPHCKKAMPVWKDAKAQLDGRTINGFKIHLTDVDCTDEKDINVKNQLKKYDIEGFPTLKMVVGDQIDQKIWDYDAKVSLNGIEEFIKSVTKSASNTAS